MKLEWTDTQQKPSKQNMAMEFALKLQKLYLSNFKCTF